MRVMLFGAAGQVGSDCAHQLVANGYQLMPVTRNIIDFAEADQVTAFVEKHSPNFVINACAYTAVDKAEQDQELADQINHLSVGALAKVCSLHSIPLIHLSTDYVFDGSRSVPYVETVPVKPLGVYGKTKLAGEKAVQEHHSKHIILRTSWVFGEQGNNFVKTMLRLAGERDALGVVADQYGCPTYAGDIVAVILKLLTHYQRDNELPWGIYHCSGCGKVSWYQFACYIFDQAIEMKLLTKAPQVHPITTAEYPTPAPRPAYSVLDNSKLEAILGQSMPSWKQGVAQLISFLKLQ